MLRLQCQGASDDFLWTFILLKMRFKNLSPRAYFPARWCSLASMRMLLKNDFRRCHSDPERSEGEESAFACTQGTASPGCHA